MTSEEHTLILIQQAIKRMPPESQEAIEEMSEHFRMVVKQAAGLEGPMAIALVGAEMAAK